MSTDLGPSPEQARLDEEIDQVLTDLADVDTALAGGDLDPATAGRLRSTYRDELAELERRRARLGEAPAPSPPGRDRRRMIAGSVLVVAALAATAVLLVTTVTDRGAGDPAVGGVPGALIDGDADLGDVTNEEMEEVVAANPEVTGMRLALAERYFAAGEFDRAVDHYLVVLEQDPDNAAALAAVGWMTHLSGRSDVAESYVERALEVEPDFPQAHWYLANIRAEGLDDPQGAVESLQVLLAADGVPEDIRSRAEEMLEEIQG